MEKSVELAVAEANLARARAEKFARHKHLLWIYPPHWCEKGEDENYTFFEEYEFLLEHGRVVWGSIVQANKHLWKPSDVMTGSTLIYSHEGVDDLSRQKLRETSGRLYDLKNAPPANDPQERAYQVMLIDEMDRALGMPVPATLSDGLDAISTSVMVPRTHMEGQMLALKQLPLLVHPEKRTAVIVPSAFWDEGFRAEWRSRVREPSQSTRDEDFAPTGRWAKLKLAMGSVLTWRFLFYAAICPLAWADWSRSLPYHFDHNPTVVQTIDELRDIRRASMSSSPAPSTPATSSTSTRAGRTIGSSRSKAPATSSSPRGSRRTTTSRATTRENRYRRPSTAA